MKYMLLIYSAESAWCEDTINECLAKSTAICHELEAEGKFVSASPLHPIATATSVRVRDGKQQVMDGPFAETTEQLGGYCIIDVESREEAIEIASRLPPAKVGTVEVRPLHELNNLPSLSPPVTQTSGLRNHSHKQI